MDHEEALPAHVERALCDALGIKTDARGIKALPGGLRDTLAGAVSVQVSEAKGRVP